MNTEIHAPDQRQSLGESAAPLSRAGARPTAESRVIDAPEPARSLLVACLCAQWCGTCREYRAVFDPVVRRFDAGLLSFTWVDVEDHDEVVGSIEVENFPTLLIARGDDALFFGTVLPHAHTLARLLQEALDGSLRAVIDDAEARALPARIRALHNAGSA